MQFTPKLAALLAVLAIVPLASPAAIPAPQVAFLAHHIAAMAPANPLLAPMGGLAYFRRKASEMHTRDMDDAILSNKDSVDHSDASGPKTPAGIRRHHHDYVELPFHVHRNHHQHDGTTIVYVGDHRHSVIIPRVSSEEAYEASHENDKRKHNDHVDVVEILEDPDIVVLDSNDSKHEHVHVHSHGGSVKIVEDGHGNSHQHIHAHVHRQVAQSDGDDTVPNLPGLPGRIDIMSPTLESPVGKRIASLFLSNSPLEHNQFVLNAANAEASTVYLVVKHDAPPLDDGALTVILQIPVYDKSKATVLPYCASFDPRPPSPSPLTAAECAKDDASAVTEHTSQSFSYNPTDGVLKPLWLASSPLGSDGQPLDPLPSGAPLPNDAKDAGPLRVASLPCNNDGMNAMNEPDLPGEETTPGMSTGPQNVALVFVPTLPPDTPVVGASQEDEEPGNVAAISNTTTSMSATTTSTGISIHTTASSTVTGSVTIVAGNQSPTASQTRVGVPSSRPATPSFASSEEAMPTISGSTASAMETASSTMDDTTVTPQPVIRRRFRRQVARQDMGPQALQAVDTGYAWKFSPTEN